MCGIIGYTGEKQAAPILIKGLSSLEYRGYDSTGLAVIDHKHSPYVLKAAGKLSNLKDSIGNKIPDGKIGLGHTRWATHGTPNKRNAHPHTDCTDDIIVVHNGIVENYLEIKKELIDKGHVFQSETDSECIPHLIEEYIKENNSFEAALTSTAKRLQGANAVVLISNNKPAQIAAFRIGYAGGIVIGYGENEMFLASDLAAILPHTRKVAYLSGNEIAFVSPEGPYYIELEGNPIKKSPSIVNYDPLSAAKGEFKHFMLKEIHEQPESMMNTFRGRVKFDRKAVKLETLPYSDEQISEIERIVLIGMGTSLHAAMVGRIWIESLAGIPAEIDNSSEFRYRDPILGPNTLVISVCQSGETADTLAAMSEASNKGAKQITLCNYPGTQTSRIAESTIQIRAGVEIGVAATKTFTNSLSNLYILALYLGFKRGNITQSYFQKAIDELAHVPAMIGSLVANQGQYVKLAQKYARYSNFLYLGRGINFPLAMEGALKLKEISYIHAEGYPAGEMKHGPISLIDENMPVVSLIPQDNLYEKMLSNISEVKARGGKIIAIATEGDQEVNAKTDNSLFIPKVSNLINPLLMAIPMQLIAYHMGVYRGCDVDQPRNLAKSVTVE